MAKYSDIVKRVSILLGTDSSLTDDEIGSLLQSRYEHLYETFNWSKRRREFVIPVIGQLQSTASTLATVTFDSSTVTVAGTPNFTVALNGRQVKLGGERQYFFVNILSTSSFTLQDGEGNNVNWPGETDTAASWSIFKTIYELPKDADDILSLAGQFQLEELSGGRSSLDMDDPDRLSVSDHPTHWFYAGAERVRLTREIELWPVPTVNRILRGQYNREAPLLSTASIMDIPAPVLVYATAADGCHLLHAKQGTTELMWENKALFFERKSQEVVKDYKINDFERTSPPNYLARSSSSSRFSGTDYEITHDLDI